MKFKLALIAFLFSGVANAATMTCALTEGKDSKALKTTHVTHEYNQNGHMVTPFDLEFASGFVAVSRGQAVVNVVLKENGQAMSFHGLVGHGVGGTLFSPGNTNWLQVLCD